MFFHFRGGDRVDRNERRERPERPERWDSRDQNERGENTRGRGGTRGMRGRGRGRGGFGTAAAPVSSGGFGKREYERRSGSDKTYVGVHFHKITYFPTLVISLPL